MDTHIQLTSKLSVSVAFIMAAFVLPENSLAADSQLLRSVQTKYDCSSRKQLDVPYTTFWAWDQSERSDFIYFDREKWAFLICLNGKMIIGALEKPGDKELEYTEVSVTEKYLEDAGENSRSSVPYLEDLNGDGKIEFIGQLGQCVEGPCMGDSTVFQIDNGRIKPLGTVDAWVVEPIKEKGRHALLVSKQCFNYDFGPAFTYFSLEEFTPGGLRTVPYNQIRNRYPETLQENLPDPEKLKASLDGDKMPLVKLVNDAYRGIDIHEIEKAYSTLLEQNSAIANVHCEPLEVIRMIAGKG